MSAFERVARIAGAVFGGYIVVTSAMGIALGLSTGEGWLAILYGCLGISMGAAGIVALWTKGGLRGALLGWFLIGIASRAILEGTVYLLFISIPIASALLAALLFELLYRPSVARTLGAVAGACLALLAMVLLAIAAPSLPVICATFPAAGSLWGHLLYPSNMPPFDVAEQSYLSHCLDQNKILVTPSG